MKYDGGTGSEVCVSEDKGCACYLTCRNAELLERAEKSGVEVSVLSRREGRFQRLNPLCGTKRELVDSCDGIYFEVLSKRFDSDVEDFLRGFSGGYSFEEFVLISDGYCYGGSCEYSVSGTCTRLS